MISCNQYDYIEIVCLYHYPVKIRLKDATILNGVAIDTVRDELKQECIKLGKAKDEGAAAEQLVILDDIASLEVCIDNPHLHYIEFNP
ncbi:MULTISPECIES: Rho-binding antiterminator [unclassified Shewanella]|uniref:Rho-binding antiterminator n=1 Tax=unclassified Shewanella TaxID=196818 RepID=UPI001BC0A854|nr:MULTISPECIES: Rho-binding antiterminator [unclassified Shewanella]GIU10242.1 hypothetical protein TUM4444_14180 [Shewanella sp. MBTL60-112-B1]GIU32537.1 hypothetical protein TUM4445_18370 [Shewanella sp. MBTL60-112-B2]